MRPGDPQPAPTASDAPPRRGTDTPRRGLPRWNLRSHWKWLLVFIIGFAILVYPVFSQWYYSTGAQQSVADFETGKSELELAAIAKRIELAKAYNDTLDPARLSDPYTPREQAGIAEYARMLEVRELLGHIEVPRINQDLPVYAGTSDAVLQKGAGHLEGTSLPIGGTDTHSVITAHRGLPEARLFTDLDRLQIGDVFFMHNIEGTLAYKVDQILTVEPSDFDPVLVQEGQDYLTLLTCTPYMINSHRLLVRGHRVPYEAAVEEAPAPTFLVPWEFVIPLALGGVLFVALAVILRKRRKARTARRAA